MEYWKEIFKDMIQEDYYEVKLINGEEYGLIIKFQGKYNAFSVKFGEVKAVRMFDEQKASVWHGSSRKEDEDGSVSGDNGSAE